MKYWAIDYVDSTGAECELVCDDQLYATEEEAWAVLERLPQPELHEVSWYSEPDLSEIFGGEISIDSDLKVHYPTW